jgi:tRNA (cmo5U34)-methyltransferase
MSVAAHLQIRVEDYDRRIRTFIPAYGDLLDATARVWRAAARGCRTPTLVDLGTGTGALAARCLAEVPSARVVGIDADAAMLRAAMKRLARLRAPATLVCADFLRTALPSTDAVVAALALHHVAEPARKRAFYRKCARALRPGGIVASGDCHPSCVDRLAADQMRAWVAHLRASYSAADTQRLLAAWAGEDTYMTLEEELAIMQGAGFAVDVAWRRGAFAVVVGVKP